jgi:hypothetical protein
VQGNRPRTSRLRARGVKTEREQRAGDAAKRGSPAGSYAGVPVVFQWHTCVSRGSSTHEQEGLEVRGGVDIANQSSSIVSSQGSTTSSSSYPSLITQPTTVTTGYREEYPPAIFHPLQPFPANFFDTHGISSPSSTSHRQSCSSREFTFHPFSSTTKATPRFALIH